MDGIYARNVGMPIINSTYIYYLNIEFTYADRI